MKFLLTNDDGIDAPGLAALVRALAPLGQCVVVAPERHLSGCSHQVTVDRPLALTERLALRYALDGTPVDCTRVGLAHLAADADWVIAGINAGGNLGADVYMSGTVAAVREAALLGRPGIAISHLVKRPAAIDWDRAARWAEHVVRQLLVESRKLGKYWNVNLPHAEIDMPPIAVCQLDRNPMPIRFAVEDGRLRYCATYQERVRHAGFDVDHCFDGRITVTELSLH